MTPPEALGRGGWCSTLPFFSACSGCPWRRPSFLAAMTMATTAGLSPPSPTTLDYATPLAFPIKFQQKEPQKELKGEDELTPCRSL
ncbi:hypothetical protein Sjap_008843 [Stephania japonica]|uniref:Uncharacterized protein n=1 Tax=Stephania japonica TaxID=461633 RepID=A0AAP0PCS1_9MAGN